VPTDICSSINESLA
jgi:hypothetical protein